MDTGTAKIFQSGNSQAVRLPKGFRLKAHTVEIVRLPDGLMLIDPAARARRQKLARKLWGNCADFPDPRA